MDCIDLFKKAAAALQTDVRYLELDAARRENDADEELQNMIGEFNLARLDLNNESAKPETDAARVAELNQRVNDLYSQIMASEGMVRYNAAKAECEALVSHMEESAVAPEQQRVYISHGDCLADAQLLAQMVRDRLHVSSVTIGDVGPVIGAHSGAGTLALFFVGTHR